MRLKNWLIEQRARLSAFGRFWAGVQAHDEDAIYPEDMQPGEWDEQFDAWSEGYDMPEDDARDIHRLYFDSWDADVDPEGGGWNVVNDGGAIAERFVDPYDALYALHRNDNVPYEPWEDDLVQFARLLSEIQATQPDLDYQELGASMDLDDARLAELFARAERRFEASKARLCPPPKPSAGLSAGDECPNCMNGTLDEAEGELRCAGECGEIWPLTVLE